MFALHSLTWTTGSAIGWFGSLAYEKVSSSFSCASTVAIFVSSLAALVVLALLVSMQLRVAMRVVFLALGVIGWPTRCPLLRRS